MSICYNFFFFTLEERNLYSDVIFIFRNLFNFNHIIYLKNFFKKERKVETLTSAPRLISSLAHSSFPLRQAS